MNRLLVIGLAIGVACTGCAHENETEKLADQITRAVAANNVAPVSAKFAPAAREKMTREAVGRLSDELVQLGKFDRTYEKTPDTAPAGTHVLDAKFDKQTWHERLVLNNKGEIIRWDIRPGATGAPAAQ